MRGRFFRLVRALHAWGGVTLALLLCLISLTGSLLVWKPDYLRLTLADGGAAISATPESLARLTEAVERELGANAVYLIEFPTPQLPLVKVTGSDGSSYAYFDARGKVLSRWQGNGRWEEWLFDLHHRLLLDNLGLTIVGCAALALIILVLAGVIVFWPMRRSFEWRVWPRDASVRSLRSAHRSAGIVLAIPLLMSLVTGAILAFPEQSQKLLLEPFRDDSYSLDFSEHLDGVSGGDSGAWLSVLQRAQSSFPGARIRAVQSANDFSVYRIVWLQQPGEWNPTGLSKVYIEAKEGHMDVRIDSQAQLPSERLYYAGYPLHTGKVGGLPYKLLLTASGLLVALLSMLGMIGFVRSRMH
ncbi:MAG: PepSY-associated TM helix domain-containing protein [Steroidobacteraceae bacterium]